MNLKLLEMHAWTTARSFTDRQQAIEAVVEKFSADANRACEAVDFGMMLDTMPPEMASACLELAHALGRLKRRKPANARKRRPATAVAAIQP